LIGTAVADIPRAPLTGEIGNCADQLFVLKWLLNEIGCARFHCLYRQWRVA
jgi:hypothetical protein